MNDYWTRLELTNRRLPNHPCVYNYVSSKINLIKKSIDFKLINNGLEIGCGNGHFTYQLQKLISNLIGIDVSLFMLGLCKKFFRSNLIRATAIKLPFKDNSFDLVFSANILHHVFNPSDIISEIRRITKEFYILIEPNRNNPLMSIFAIFNKYERLVLKYPLDFFKKLLLNQKFSIIDSFSTGIIAPNKLPTFLTPFFKSGDLKKLKFGLYNVIISKKN
ncbi:MAG: class I SAM-dependent methyltransferase [Promethearchaeota archaeon]